MCRAITKSGEVCKNKSESLFCHIHQGQETLEEKRNRIISKLLSTSGITFTLQNEAWPLFRGINLTSETVALINRARCVHNWSDEIYNNLISNYLDDGVDEEEKYDLFRRTIATYSNPGITIIEKIQINYLCEDITLLFTKYTLSKGRYFDFENFRKIYAIFMKARKALFEIYREINLKKLRVKEVEKYTPICDDVRKYILADYL